jgi:nitrogen regulatory protein P-II 1
MKRSFTTLTDATLITAVVQSGYGEVITDALLEIGIQGSTIHAAMGVGIR